MDVLIYLQNQYLMTNVLVTNRLCSKQNILMAKVFLLRQLHDKDSNSCKQVRVHGMKWGLRAPLSN